MRARGEVARAALIALGLGLALVLLGPRPATSRAPLPHGARRGRRLRLGHVLVRGAVPALHLQPPLLRLCALLGNDLAALVAVVAAAVLFASLAEREWGEGGPLAGPRLRSRRLRPALHRNLPVRGRTGDEPRCAEGASARPPLDGYRSRRAHAGLLAARLPLPLSRRRGRVPGAPPPLRRVGGRLGGALLALGLFQGALLLLYREEAEYPFFRLSELLALIVLSATCAGLALRAERGRPRRRLRALGPRRSGRVHGPSPIGENVAPARDRPAAGAPRGRARRVPAAVAGGLRRCLGARLHARPLRRRRLHRTDTRSAEPSFWEPALAFLDARLTPTSASRWFRPATTGRPTGFGRGLLARARMVPPARHRPESALLRGRSSPTPTGTGWRRSASATSCSRRPSSPPGRGARGRAGPFGARGLGRSPAPETDRVRGARRGAILTSPREARLLGREHDRVEGEVRAPGAYRLAVRWTPTWRVTAGDVCVEEASTA